MTESDLVDVKIELDRFEKRLSALFIRMEKDKFALYGCNESGAVKRAALDLKLELSKITR